MEKLSTLPFCGVLLVLLGLPACSSVVVRDGDSTLRAGLNPTLSANTSVDTVVGELFGTFAVDAMRGARVRAGLN